MVFKTTTELDWRASLVPAAAVTPASIAYTNAVAVKKLVVRQGLVLAGRWGCCHSDSESPDVGHMDTVLYDGPVR